VAEVYAIDEEDPDEGNDLEKREGTKGTEKARNAIHLDEHRSDSPRML